MYFVKLAAVSCFLLLILPRRLAGHKAAILNEQVLVTGGKDVDREMRDEVLCEILSLVMRYLACQFSGAPLWFRDRNLVRAGWEAGKGPVQYNYLIAQQRNKEV